MPLPLRHSPDSSHPHRLSTQLASGGQTRSSQTRKLPPADRMISRRPVRIAPTMRRATESGVMAPIREAIASFPPAATSKNSLLVVLGRHIPSLEFLDVLLGDRPALTPVEGFYQRMLAEDPDEALEQAESQLADRSLTAYYDEVALAALKLAAADVERGAITRDRAGRVVDSMLVLVSELEHQDDTANDQETRGGMLKPLPDNGARFDETAPVSLPAAPVAWQTGGSILCIAGRGVLDDAVTAMLQQLLAKRGFGVNRVPHEAGSRANIDRLDASGARMVCISYLEIGGSPSHLRYLVRRIRSRVGDVPILVGLWPEGEAALTDEEIQRTLGADLYVGSLGAAVEACLDHAGGHLEQAA